MASQPNLAERGMAVGLRALNRPITPGERADSAAFLAEVRHLNPKIDPASRGNWRNIIRSASSAREWERRYAVRLFVPDLQIRGVQMRWRGVASAFYLPDSTIQLSPFTRAFRLRQRRQVG